MAVRSGAPVATASPPAATLVRGLTRALAIAALAGVVQVSRRWREDARSQPTAASKEATAAAPPSDAAADSGGAANTAGGHTTSGATAKHGHAALLQLPVATVTTLADFAALVGGDEPVVCRGCALAVPAVTPLLGNETLRGVSVLRSDDGSSTSTSTGIDNKAFWVRDDSMPLEINPPVDSHQVRGLEVAAAELLDGWCGIGHAVNATPPHASVYYNGDTRRIPEPHRSAVVGRIESIFGDVLARVATSPLSSNLWISCGASGVRVQPHFDTVVNVLVQLEGSKTMVLAPPGADGITALPFLSVHSRHAAEPAGDEVWAEGRAKSAEGDGDKIDGDAVGTSDGGGGAQQEMLATPGPWRHRVTLKPGSALYVPPGTWHAVATPPGTTSVSVSVFADSTVDALADATSALPFDVDADDPGAAARALAVYCEALLHRLAGGDADGAAALGCDLAASIAAAWRRAGADGGGGGGAAAESRCGYGSRADGDGRIVGCDADWATLDSAGRLGMLTRPLADQIRNFVASTLPGWRTLRGEALRREQLRAHLETVAFAGVGGRAGDVPCFFCDCL